jgi:hypothetical protein
MCLEYDPEVRAGIPDLARFLEESRGEPNQEVNRQVRYGQ